MILFLHSLSCTYPRLRLQVSLSAIIVHKLIRACGCRHVCFMCASCRSNSLRVADIYLLIYLYILIYIYLYIYVIILMYTYIFMCVYIFTYTIIMSER